ncbi:hypothetical protein cyc_02820 [Cyclospora cayetanensis]|uniref:Uncharacterized protein n=1 Tax=Cyclospora cayetanensis TaxID=88456 RepID=A0A1D3DAX9_9EIME|nr:hypothetical protein cyc_02820 [Cyclospora cayetanensis]
MQPEGPLSPSTAGAPSGSWGPPAPWGPQGAPKQLETTPHAGLCMCLVGMRAAGKTLFASAAADSGDAAAVDLDRFIEEHFLKRLMSTAGQHEQLPRLRHSGPSNTPQPATEAADTAAAIAAGVAVHDGCNCSPDRPLSPFCCFCATQRKQQPTPQHADPQQHLLLQRSTPAQPLPGCVCLGLSPCRSVRSWRAAAFPVHCRSRQQLPRLHHFIQRFGISTFRSVEAAAAAFCLYMASSPHAAAALPVYSKSFAAFASQSANYPAFGIYSPRQTALMEAEAAEQRLAASLGLLALHLPEQQEDNEEGPYAVCARLLHPLNALQSLLGGDTRDSQQQPSKHRACLTPTAAVLAAAVRLAEVYVARLPELRQCSTRCCYIPAIGVFLRAAAVLTEPAAAAEAPTRVTSTPAAAAAASAAENSSGRKPEPSIPTATPPSLPRDVLLLLKTSAQNAEALAGVSVLNVLSTATQHYLIHCVAAVAKAELHALLYRPPPALPGSTFLTLPLPLLLASTGLHAPPADSQEARSLLLQAKEARAGFSLCELRADWLLCELLRTAESAAVQSLHPALRPEPAVGATRAEAQWQLQEGDDANLGDLTQAAATVAATPCFLQEAVLTASSICKGLLGCCLLLTFRSADEGGALAPTGRAAAPGGMQVSAQADAEAQLLCRAAAASPTGTKIASSLHGSSNFRSLQGFRPHRAAAAFAATRVAVAAARSACVAADALLHYWELQRLLCSLPTALVDVQSRYWLSLLSSSEASRQLDAATAAFAAACLPPNRVLTDGTEERLQSLKCAARLQTLPAWWLNSLRLASRGCARRRRHQMQAAVPLEQLGLVRFRGRNASLLRQLQRRVFSFSSAGLHGMAKLQLAARIWEALELRQVCNPLEGCLVEVLLAATPAAAAAAVQGTAGASPGAVADAATMEAKKLLYRLKILREELSRSLEIRRFVTDGMRGPCGGGSAYPSSSQPSKEAFAVAYAAVAAAVTAAAVETLRALLRRVAASALASIEGSNTLVVGSVHKTQRLTLLRHVFSQQAVPQSAVQRFFRKAASLFSLPFTSVSKLVLFPFSDGLEGSSGCTRTSGRLQQVETLSTVSAVLEQMLRKPMMVLIGGEAWRMSRVRCSVLSPCCSITAAVGVYGQLPRPVLLRAKLLMQQSCLGVFLLGFPTINSPTPFLYSLMLRRQQQQHQHVYTGFYPPLEEQHRYLTKQRQQHQGHADAEFRFWLQQLLRKERALLGGASVTIPFKEEVLPLVDYVHGSARAVGAPEDVCCILLLGAGGTARAALAAVAQWCSRRERGSSSSARDTRCCCGSSSVNVYILNRTLSRAESLAREFGAAGAVVNIEALQDAHIDVIINVRPPSCPLSLPSWTFSRHPLLIELVYAPPQTPLLRLGSAWGCPAVYGLELFLWQARMQTQLILWGLQWHRPATLAEEATVASSAPFLKDLKALQAACAPAEDKEDDKAGGKQARLPDSDDDEDWMAPHGAISHCLLDPSVPTLKLTTPQLRCAVFRGSCLSTPCASRIKAPSTIHTITCRVFRVRQCCVHAGVLEACPRLAKGLARGGALRRRFLQTQIRRGASSSNQLLSLTLVQLVR